MLAKSLLLVPQLRSAGERCALATLSRPPALIALLTAMHHLWMRAAAAAGSSGASHLQLWSSGAQRSMAGECFVKPACMRMHARACPVSSPHACACMLVHVPCTCRWTHAFRAAPHSLILQAGGADEDGDAAKGKVHPPRLLGGRYGSRLRRAGNFQQFDRMRTILGAEDSSTSTSSSVPSKPIDKVTVSILQSMRYLRLDPTHKQQLAAYRLAALGRELAPLMGRTEAFLSAGSRTTTNEGTAPGASQQ
jgi:hypothetical protein